MVEKSYIPRRRDVVRVDLNPVKGHEQANLRPVLVVSPQAYNKKTGLMIVCAITSHVKGYPYEVSVNQKKVVGVVLTDQIRTLDWNTRQVKYLGIISESVMAEVQENISTLLL